MTDEPQVETKPVPEPTPGDDVRRHGGALTGAVVGGLVGSIVPGLGTVIGAGLGAWIGHLRDESKHG